MSVLLSFALLLAANQLASRLKHANALPARGQTVEVSPATAKPAAGAEFVTSRTPIVKRKRA